MVLSSLSGQTVCCNRRGTLRFLILQAFLWMVGQKRILICRRIRLVVDIVKVRLRLKAEEACDPI